jgi:hypothetical protein
LGAGFTLALGIVGLITVAALAGWLPIFFVPGQGGTLVRQVVLASAIAMFALTAVLLWEENRPSWPPFAYWYSLALWMIAVGLFGMMIQSARYTRLDWACRASQYGGGIYMLIAALASRRERESRALGVRRGMSLATDLAWPLPWFWRPPPCAWPFFKLWGLVRSMSRSIRR